MLVMADIRRLARLLIAFCETSNDSTEEDIRNACLNPLPTFYAVDIARLSPLSASHCDMSAVVSLFSIFYNYILCCCNSSLLIKLVYVFHLFKTEVLLSYQK